VHRTVLLIGLNLSVLFAGMWSGRVEAPGSGAYPSKPIKLIVPFGAGGGTDTYARIIKKAIEDNRLLPQPLVIVNIDGAGATIGSRRAKDAKPDGYTLLILHDAILTAKYSRSVDYGPEAFEPVAGTGEVGMVITVSENSPYHDLQALMQAAKENPNKIKFGANMGALTHFAGLQLEKAFPGAKFRYAQFGGGAKRFAALKGGHIALTGFSIEEFVRFRSENLRGLAYFGESRHAAALDVPTALEQGFDISGSNTFYWWFPKGTPKSCIDVMANVLQKAMQTEYVQQRMAKIHCTPIFVREKKLQDRIDETTIRIAAVDPPQPTDLPNFPAIVFMGVVFATVAVGTQTLRKRRQYSMPFSFDEHEGNATRRPWLAATCLGLTVAYVMALALEWGDFRVVTILFVSAVGVSLTGMKFKKLPELFLIAQCLGFGLHFLFTQVFVVDLP
jgi:tripartite-type tricarboxylate transporter receptor subunit TctC